MFSDLLKSYIFDYLKSVYMQPPNVLNQDTSTYTIQEYEPTRAIRLLQSNSFYNIVISGIMGSGKTTTALRIVHDIQSKLKDGVCVYINSIFINENIIDKLKNILNENKTEYLYVILDDVSYILTTFSKKQLGIFNNKLARIRHLLNAKTLVIVVTHTQGGINPLLRNTNEWIYQSIAPNDLVILTKHVKLSMNNRYEKMAKILNAINANGKVYDGNKLIILKENTKCILVYNEIDLNLYSIRYIHPSKVSKIQITVDPSVVPEEPRLDPRESREDLG